MRTAAKRFFLWSGLMALVFVMALGAPAAQAQSTVQLPPLSGSAVFTIGSENVTVDGQVYRLDVAPYIDAEGRTMLPARYVGELLNCDVAWEPDVNTVVLVQRGGSVVLTLTIGSDVLSCATGTKVSNVRMGTAAVIVPPGRTMIPVRFVAQALGFTLGWDAATRTVTLQSGTGAPAPNQPAPNTASGSTASQTPGTSTSSGSSSSSSSATASSSGSAGAGGGSSSSPPSPPAAAPVVTGAAISLNGTPVAAVINSDGTAGTITLSGPASAVVSNPTITVSEAGVLTISAPSELAGEQQQMVAGQNTLGSLAGVLALVGQNATLGNLDTFVEAATGGNTFSIDGTLSNSGGSTPLSLQVILNVQKTTASVQSLSTPNVTQ